MTFDQLPTGERYDATDINWLIEAFRSMTPEQIAERGFSVEGTFDEVDDPVLLGPDGLPVMTWREGYPYAERMGRREYEEHKRALQIELLKAQDWIKETGYRLVLVFEGRDAAGKGGTIKRFREHLDPRGADVVALGVPSAREQGEWFFQRYVQHLPTRGEIRFFDRSWYNRAVVEPVMGYCTPDEHEEFLRAVPEFERMLVNSGIALVKLWFSVSRPGAAVEAEPDRHRLARSLGRLHRCEAEDVRAHLDRSRAVDDRAEQRQEAWPHQRHAARPRGRAVRRQGSWRRGFSRPVDRRDARAAARPRRVVVIAAGDRCRRFVPSGRRNPIARRTRARVRFERSSTGEEVAHT
jgi:hypothetical protein